MLVLFMERRGTVDAAAGRFLRTGGSRQTPRSSRFESLLQSGKPRCGQVRDAQRDYLFGKDSVEIGSVALDARSARRARSGLWRSARATRTAFTRP